MAKTDLREFDYKLVARMEADMWRAYYNHQFVKMTFLILDTLHTQLRVSWLLTVRMAWHTGVAAAKFRLQRGHEDYDGARRRLIKYYKILSSHSVQTFDYKKAAEVELKWWDVHRYPKKYKKTLEQALADVQAVIYGIPASRFKEYSHYKAIAAELPNHLGDNQPNPPDYEEIKDILTKSWGALHKAVNKNT